MDLGNPTNRNPNSSNSKLQLVQGLGSTVAKGQNADVVLKLLDPILEKRLGVLLDQLAQVPAELGPVLDIRAKICEAWRMRKQLRSAVLEGNSADEALRAMLEQLSAKAPNSAPNKSAS